MGEQPGKMSVALSNALSKNRRMTVISLMRRFAHHGGQISDYEDLPDRDASDLATTVTTSSRQLANRISLEPLIRDILSEKGLRCFKMTIKRRFPSV